MEGEGKKANLTGFRINMSLRARLSGKMGVIARGSWRHFNKPLYGDCAVHRLSY